MQWYGSKIVWNFNSLHYLHPSPPATILVSFFFGGDSITALLKYNLHTMQFIHLKCTIKWFLICSQVVQPSPQPILEYFSYPRKKSCTLQLSPLLPPTHLILRQLLIYFLSVDLPVLEISYKWNHIYSLLCLSYSFFFVGI